MKIAFINNIANNFFSLARYFRDLGADAHLYCKLGYQKWLPIHDDETATQHEWIKFVDFSWSPDDFLKGNFGDFSFLKEYDHVFCCGFLPFFLQKSGVRCNFFLPYGGEITDAYSTLLKGQTSVTPEHSGYREFMAEHFRAIANIPIVLTTPYEPVTSALNLSGISFLSGQWPIVYPPLPKPYQSPSHEFDLHIFSHSRQLWLSAYDCIDKDEYLSSGGIKRNDKLVRAFSKLVCRYPKKKTRLSMVAYGPDWQRTLALASSLKLDSNHFYMHKSKLKRQEIFENLRVADITANAFRENIFDFGSVCLEALVSSSVLLNNASGAHSGYETCPGLSATGEDEIFEGLERMLINPIGRRDLKAAGKRWFDSNFGVESAKRFFQFLQVCGNYKKADWPKIFELTMNNNSDVKYKYFPRNF